MSPCSTSTVSSPTVNEPWPETMYTICSCGWVCGRGSWPGLSVPQASVAPAPENDRRVTPDRTSLTGSSSYFAFFITPPLPVEEPGNEAKIYDLRPARQG